MKYIRIFLITFCALSIICLAGIIGQIAKSNRSTSEIFQEIWMVFKESIGIRDLELESNRNLLVSHFRVYDAQDENGSLELLRHGKEYDGGYVVAVKALEKADVILGYGIDNDNSFEDDFSLKYNRPSYGFDCGIGKIDSKSKLFTLVKECIATDKFLYGSGGSDKITSFDEQLDNLHLRGKNIFIKMDIEGAEYDAFSSITKYHENITGIALEIHYRNPLATKKAVELLQNLDKNFVLIHVHGNNCCKQSGFSTPSSIGIIPSIVELSYINKNLVAEYSLSNDQFHPTKMDQPNNQYRPDSKFEITK